jgi:iron complex transport system substrate-binding protein
MTRAFLVLLVTAVAAAAIWTANQAPAGLLPSPRRPYQSYGSPQVRTERPAYPRHATGADDVRVRIDRPARRIVSQHAYADEYLYAVVPAERIVGVSETAYDRRFSNVFEHAARYRPIVANDPERVLLANPDLVITAESVRAEVPDLLRQSGVPVYRMYTMFETLAAIEEHVRLIGYLTGEDERAAAEVVRFRAAITQAAARRPANTAAPRVLGLGLGGGYSYGSRTLFNDILRVLGAENVSATHGLVGYDRASDERIVRWNPDWIVASADPGMAERTRASLLARPSIAETDAARLGHIVILDNRVFLPLSPFTSALVESLSQALYGRAAT